MCAISYCHVLSSLDIFSECLMICGIIRRLIVNLSLGSCTVAIVMVTYFQDKPGELPGGDWKGPPSDLSSWQDVYLTAKRLVEKCVMEKNKLGWSQIGMLLGSMLSFVQ